MRLILFIFLSSLSLSLQAQAEEALRQAEGLSKQGRYEASNEVLEEFLKKYESRLYDLGEAHFLKSYNFLQLGQLEQALEENEASLQLRQQFIPEDAAKNYLRYGQVYSEWKQYERALDYFFRAEDFPLIDNPQIAALLKESIGGVFTQLGAFEKARAAYRQSANILQIEEGEESAGVAQAYYQIGRAYMLEGQPKEAGAWLEKALNIEKKLEGGARRQGHLYLALGQAAEQEGDKAKAEGFYQQASQIFQGLPADKYQAVAQSLLHIAQLKMRTGDLGGARMAVQGALQNICPDFHPERLEDNPNEKNKVISYSLLAEAMALKSNISIAAFRAGEGLSQLELALAVGLSGIALAKEKTGKQGLLYEAAATSAFLLHQNTGREMYAEKAFELSEHAKMLDLPGPPSVPTTGLKDIRQQLGKKEALITYFLSPQATFALLFTQDEVKAVSLGADAPTITRSTEACLRSIKEEDGPAFSVSSFQLYQVLVEPMEKQLKKIDKLIIVPHHSLQNLPFEALLTKAPKSQEYHQLHFLIEDFVVEYHLTASGLTRQAADKRGEGILAVAPLYDLQYGNGLLSDDNAYLFNPAFQVQDNLREVVPDGKAIFPLAGSEEEVEAIKNTFKEKAAILLGREATEQALVTTAAPYRYLHLASYGYTHGINPALSGILLSQPEEAESADGIFFASERAGLSLNAALVVIPHCACGSKASRPGISGISQPFLKAGAAQVMASLWLDGQYPANLWMGAFYEKLLRGGSPAEALQEMKKEMLKEKEKAAPKKWSGVILIGQ